MNNYSSNGNSQLEAFETPFADAVIREVERAINEQSSSDQRILPSFESPFNTTYESASASTQATSPQAGQFVNFLGELHNDEFGEHLFEMAAELENTWNSRISNEMAMGDRFVPFATEQANQYFIPVLNETAGMIDRVSNNFSGNNFMSMSEREVDQYFERYAFEHGPLSPAQEEFFGAIFDKVKSVVKTGINLAKKGVAAVGKILPIGDVLKKLKGLIKPLLDKVLKFAIGKLPKTLQPHAHTLAKKFLNLEASESADSNEIATTGNLESVQSELDGYIANLMFTGSDTEASDLVSNYEFSDAAQQREDAYEAGGMQVPSLDAARQQFINDLKELQAGESPAPAIERFLPAAILALQPIIKIAITIIGRQKVINFLADLLAKLISKYVPAEVVKPLAAGIIDLGMSAIGFETYETGSGNVGYEAIANTIQETIQNLSNLSEETLNDQEALMAETLEAFEIAAANNFPARHLKPQKRLSENGNWVMMPRSGPKHLYKKFTQVFDVMLDSKIATTLTTFRGIPLAGFLKDKMGIDLSSPVKARVHLYETIPGTKLYMINRFEKVPGLGASVRFGHRQLHPLTVEAASLLCKEPKLGKNFDAKFTTRRHQTAVGQRFFFLEIPGARLKVVPVLNTGNKNASAPGVTPDVTGAPVAANVSLSPAPATMDAPAPAESPANGTATAAPAEQSYVGIVPNSSDVQGVINFVRSEIRLNYFFSEEEAKSVAQKIKQHDYAGAFISVKYSVRNVLHSILIRNVGSKVKIIHEAMPELFMDNYADKQEAFWGAIGSAITGAASTVGKEMLQKLIEKLVTYISEAAYNAVVNYFRTRKNEFLAAQAAPQDGVTIKLVWFNIQSMQAISTVINAFKGRLTVGNIADMATIAIPRLPIPEVKIIPGKNFD